MVNEVTKVVSAERGARLSVPHDQCNARPMITYPAYGYTLSPRFNGHFPGEPGLAGVY